MSREWNFRFAGHVTRLVLVLHNVEGKCPAVGMDIAHDSGMFQLIGRRGVESSSTKDLVLCLR